MMTLKLTIIFVNSQADIKQTLNRWRHFRKNCEEGE